MQRHIRLTQSKDFDRLRRHGITRSHSWLVLSIVANELAHNRYGFITGKRLGKAVVRNRVRRQLREVMRLLHSQLRQGYDVVIIARPSLVEQPFHAIQRIIEQLCQQVALLSRNGG